MKEPIPFILYRVVVLPSDDYKRKEFIKWYNKQFGVSFNGNSKQYLIPYNIKGSSGKRCDNHFPNAPRITFEQWKQQYCLETYSIY